MLSEKGAFFDAKFYIPNENFKTYFVDPLVKDEQDITCTLQLRNFSKYAENAQTIQTFNFIIFLKIGNELKKKKKKETCFFVLLFVRDIPTYTIT